MATNYRDQKLALRELNVQRIHGRNTRAADIYSFTREHYQNTKYQNSPFYKGTVSWDKLPINARQFILHTEFKKLLTHVYREYSDVMS